MADQKEILRWVLVHALQIASVCSRNNGSSRTSASSNTRCRTEGSDSFSSAFFLDRALTNASGVVTRISLFVRASVFLLSFDLADLSASSSPSDSEPDVESSESLSALSSSARATTCIPFLMAVIFTPVPIANLRPSLTI